MKPASIYHIKNKMTLKRLYHCLKFQTLLLIVLTGCTSTQPRIDNANMWARAARLGDIEMIIHLEKNNFNDEDANGLTALMIASRFGKVEMVQYLLSHGAKADTIDHDKQSALDYVLYANLPVESKRIITQLLLEKGADPFRPNFLGLAPIYEMVANGFLDEIKILRFTEKSACDRMILKSTDGSIVNLAIQNEYTELAHYLKSMGCP
jgi:ankyrin repeat protein